MRKPRVLFSLAAFAVLVSAMPAGAAVPRRAADDVLPCGQSDGSVVRVWNSRGRFAVKNECTSSWLVITATPWESESGVTSTSVAPGAHFNWKGEVATTADEDNLDTTYRWAVRPAPEYCAPDGSEVVLRGSHGRPVDASSQCRDSG